MSEPRGEMETGMAKPQGREGCELEMGLETEGHLAFRRGLKKVGQRPPRSQILQVCGGEQLTQ